MKSRDVTRRFFSRPLGRSPFAPAPFQIPRWVWLVVGVWLAWVTVISDHSLLRIVQLKREIASAESETRKLKDETSVIENQLGDPSTRRFHAEEIARTQHGWAAPGEIVYRFKDDHAKADSTR